MISEQQEFLKLDKFLEESITPYTFELQYYPESMNWFASICYRMYDDDISVVASGKTRLEVITMLNNKLTAKPDYRIIDYRSSDYNHE